MNEQVDEATRAYSRMLHAAQGYSVQQGTITLGEGTGAIIEEPAMNIPRKAVEAAGKSLYERERCPFVAWESVDKRTQGYFMSEARTALDAAAPHILAGANAALEIAGAALKLEINRGRDAVKVPRKNLEGWHDTPPLTGADWRALAESLPASEYATALLYIADAMDNPHGSQP